MSATNYLDQLLSPITGLLTPEVARALADIRVDDELQSYVNSLATKANEGHLTSAEEAEYQALIDAADLVSVLQIKARRFLRTN